MKTLLLFVIIFAVINSVFSVVTQNFLTNNRQVYGTWGACDGCDCEYFTVTATEYNTRDNTNHNNGETFYLYYSHAHYDTCAYTYSDEYILVTEPFTGLSINTSGRSARLNVTDLIDSNGNNVDIHLVWTDVDSNGACNCRYTETYGPNSYRVVSRSTYTKTDLLGFININGIRYEPSNPYGNIYNTGSKSMTITHV